MTEAPGRTHHAGGREGVEVAASATAVRRALAGKEAAGRSHEDCIRQSISPYLSVYIYIYII